jgi:signal transduction histidine kinase
LIGGAALLSIAALGMAYSVLVWRAAPRRRENRVFAALALCDAAQVAWRGIMILAAYPMDADVVLTPCTVATMGLAVLSAEFLWGAADGPRMPRWLRWTIIGSSLVAAFITVYSPHGSDGGGMAFLQYAYFTPMTAAIVLLAVRALRRSKRVGVRLIAGALIFRWIFGHIVWSVGEPFGVLRELLWIESTAAVIVSCVIIGHAILRDQLFSVRGAFHEAADSTLFGLTIVGVTAAAIGGALQYLPPGAGQHVALVASAFVPVVMLAIGRVLYPRIETRVLAGLDDRRAARLDALAEPLPDDADAALDDGRGRLERLTGGEVRWLPALPPALDEHLATSADPDLRRGPERAPALTAALDELGTDLVVAARVGHRVIGAWALRGGTIDRDTLLVARALAGQVAIALDRRRVLGELEEARRLAALGQFAAAIAHDIRTPLQSVTMNVQILRRKAQLPADDMEYFDIALEELARLERSVAEILDYAKPVRIAAAAIDVRDLVDDAARSLAPVVEGKGLQLATDHEVALPPVIVDPQRLRQVLTNLVDNAASASAPGAAVTLRTRRDADRVVIDVEDRGRGIPADDLVRIFEPFYTTRPDGVGLGLAICQKLVRAHGGELRVRSAPGQGSTFSVVLPAPVA